MAMSPVRVAVVGATGSVGEQVLERLARHADRFSVSAFGGPSRSPRVDQVPFGEASLPVDPVGAIAMVKLDAAVVCIPTAAARAVIPALAARGVVAIDVGDSTAGVVDAPLWVPSVGGLLPEGVPAAGVVRTPTAPGWLVAALAAPLVELGLSRVEATVLLPATSRGRAPSEELGQQVVASFTQGDPPRRYFPDGLAFDLLPEDVPPDEWSDRERLAAEEVAELTGLASDRVVITLATAPLFSGMSASLHLSGVGVDDAEVALSGAGALKSVQRTNRLRPRAFTGREQVGWGRLRPDPAGDGVHLWAAGDNLAGAGATAVEVLLRLAEAGIVSGSEA